MINARIVYNIAMYELYPYFTNDGTVGLFSQHDDDIYHSTYGALTESWQKFVNPSHLREFLETHESVKILDICYGIGYNTKTALSLFVDVTNKTNENFLKKIISKKSKKNNEKKDKNNSSSTPRIAAIHTDNILQNELDEKNNNLEKKEEIFVENLPSQPSCIAEIYTDNIQCRFIDDKNENTEITKNNVACKNILIDAVDTDNVLIGLSPFIKTQPQKRALFNKCIFKANNRNTGGKNKIHQLEKIKNSTPQNIQNKYRLKNEVAIIILEKLLENKSDIFNDKILQKILTDKKHLPFMSKFMLNLVKFYQNKGYKNTSEQNKSTFLHNIYYEYLSRSYKNAKKVLKKSKIDLNIHAKDARRFIKASETKYDFIFLDAFTPSKCPALWSVEFFGELHKRLTNDGIILTYSNSAAIRNAFLQNGFFVGKTYDKDLKKFVGTIATKNKNLIENDLSPQDLELVYSKAGICFRDENLELDNSIIIANRMKEVENSELVSSSKVLKGRKHARPI